MNSPVTVLDDSLTLAKRNLIKIKRLPDLLVFTLLSPVMFVLVFAYIFGSAIEIPGMSYREFLIAGIFVQTIVFGSTWSGLSLVEDLQKGIIDRFRTLPMSPSSVLFGRTMSDVVINGISLVVMVLTGLVVGWRIRSSPLEALAAFALLLFFGYALSWVMATIGLSISSPEVFNNASFIVIFPLTFIANAFVRAEDLPGVLRDIAYWNPISAVVQATRELFGNTNPLDPPPDVWPLQNPVLASLLWCFVILAIFIPVASWRFRKAVSR